MKIAKKALQTYVRTKEQEIPLYHLPREMEGKKGGVYVSLYVNGILRGSMGTVEATQDSLAQEIVKNTISAGAFDPRHQPITEEELESVSDRHQWVGSRNRIAGKRKCARPGGKSHGSGRNFREGAGADQTV